MGDSVADDLVCGYRLIRLFVRGECGSWWCSGEAEARRKERSHVVGWSAIGGDMETERKRGVRDRSHKWLVDRWRR
eukprot:9499666-Pyramimonas_sp.AAC.2